MPSSTFTLPGAALWAVFNTATTRALVGIYSPNTATGATTKVTTLKIA